MTFWQYYSKILFVPLAFCKLVTATVPIVKNELVLYFRQVWFTLPFGPLQQACWPHFKVSLWLYSTAFLIEM